MPQLIDCRKPLDDQMMPGNNVIVAFTKELGFGFGGRVDCHFLVPGVITLRNKTRFTVKVGHNAYSFMRHGAPYGKPITPMSVTHIEDDAVVAAIFNVAAELQSQGCVARTCPTLESIDTAYRELDRLTHLVTDLWAAIPKNKRNATIPMSTLRDILVDPGSRKAVEIALDNLKTALKFEG
ncbi:hypothetical protein CPT_Saba_031 [Proteus phage Saba]|uniref:Uncharacterized protein n=1 Tax=Proteus phage Saba TaxID=2596672 RepID=A0A5B9N5Y1_9CAUD|nr:hypothetical protein JT320_gp31 [Proteus phage Saba]QEG09404.1 hypothetical protein CPT_Saba_031 [Proteus phage Saba]